MFKKLLLTTLSIAAFSAAASVNAATYNFVDLIDGPGAAPGTFSGTLGDGPATNTSNPTGEAGYSTFTYTVDGLALTATARLGTSTLAYAYLDSGAAGLGVCQTLTPSYQCTPSSDDNVTLDEVLQISFDQTVSIDVAAMVFNDEGHGLLNNNLLTQVYVATPGTARMTIASLMEGPSSVITGMNFAFATFPDNKQQFYISSLTAVPIPAAAWLFGSALIGLAGVARKRKMS